MRASVFSGRNLQIVLTGLFAFLLTFAGVALLLDKSWFLGIFLIVTAVLTLRTYWTRSKIHAKYLFPGVALLILFHIYPALYSGQVAFTNDSNGHQLSKPQAIAAILEDSRIPVEGQEPIKYQLAIRISDEKLFAFFRYPGPELVAGNSEQVVLITESEVTLESSGLITSVRDFNLLSPDQYSLYSNEIQSLEIRLGSSQALIPDDYDYLSLFKAGRIYSEARDEIVDLATGVTYTSNDNGQMVSSSGEVLYPGWKANVGFRNFTSIFANEEVRRPLLAVVAWTFINAILVVFFSFLMGLILALIFNFPALRSKRLYRTIFIIPLAIPSVLSILVWAGLFQTSNGVINRLFHSEIPWLTDATWARIAILVVELWISFPYMFLISTGAIQSIPGEILEAASIDGASNFKSFTQIKLPLVVRTVAPLLVASGAMALNNFGIIYLLTGGGPTLANSNGNAGATDILISYTYKLAFNAQEGNNYGLASALSILNFLMVGLISIYGLKRIKTMEGVN